MLKVHDLISVLIAGTPDKSQTETVIGDGESARPSSQESAEDMATKDNSGNTCDTVKTEVKSEPSEEGEEETDMKPCKTELKLEGDVECQEEVITETMDTKEFKTESPVKEEGDGVKEEVRNGEMRYSLKDLAQVGQKYLNDDEDEEDGGLRHEGAMHYLKNLVNHADGEVRAGGSDDVNKVIYCIDGLVQERRNSSALAMDYGVKSSCTNPSIWGGSCRCGCLVTWFCHQSIAKAGDQTATPPTPDPYCPIRVCMGLVYHLE